MTPAQQDIQAMHAAYVRGTGLDVPLDAAREMAWWEAWRRGLRAADISLVIGHMRQKMKRQQPVRSFAFRKFVGDADYLEEDVIEARAAARIRRPDPARADVLQASGREPAATPPPARSAAEIVSSERFQQELQRLKEELR